MGNCHCSDMNHLPEENQAWVDAQGAPVPMVGMAEGGDDESAEAGSNKFASLESRTSVDLMFKNDAKVPVRLYWCDYTGEEQSYRTIAPGATYRQPTYHTHPWTFKPARDEDRAENIIIVTDNKRTHVIATATDAEITLARAKGVAWSPETHHLFPEDFRAITRELVFCHHRLNNPHPGSPLEVPRKVPGAPLDVPAGGRGGEAALSPAGEPEDITGSSRREGALHFGELPGELLLLCVAELAPWVPDVRGGADEDPNPPPPDPEAEAGGEEEGMAEEG